MVTENISNKQLYELICSKIDGKFEDLAKKIDENKTDLTNQIAETNSNICKLQIENNKLKKRVEILERNIRKNNIAVFGLNEIDENNLLASTQKKIKEVLKIEIKQSEINNIYKPKSEHQITPVIVELTTFLKKSEIFKAIGKLKENNLEKLKESGLIITNDLPKEERDKQKVLRKKLKNARSKNQNAKIQRGKLLINGKIYDYEDLKNDREEENKSGNENINSLEEQEEARVQSGEATGSGTSKKPEQSRLRQIKKTK